MCAVGWRVKVGEEMNRKEGETWVLCEGKPAKAGGRETREKSNYTERYPKKC